MVTPSLVLLASAAETAPKSGEVNVALLIITALIAVIYSMVILKPLVFGAMDRILRDKDKGASSSSADQSVGG